MFKKALQIAVTFSLLVGAYVGYARIFALVAEHLDRGYGPGEAIPFAATESKSALRATELARTSFGLDHWSAQKDLQIRYYDAVHGYYMYAQNYERLNDGKQLRIWPMAVVWASKDGQSHKTETSNEAVIDLNQPFGLSKPGAGPTRVVHAQMLGEVRLRDDKGTRDDPEDDLRIGPMTHLDYDEKTLQITTDSDIFLQDRDLTLTGLGMMIQLRRKVGAPAEGGGMGFDAETAYVYKDVNLVVKNVGSSGILTGTPRPEKGGQTPLRVQSDNELRIDLPRPHPVVAVGPPDLLRQPDPTLARFKTNVRVLQGTVAPDMLNCDTLDLTLMPVPKPGAPAVVVLDPAGTPAVAVAGTTSPPPAAGTGGPLTELKLRKALAQGHAVWLQSESHGLKARCVELKYEKHYEDGIPDRTYLNGGASKKLWVEKVDLVTQGEKAGTIRSVLTLNALDATIFDYGKGGASKVIARGPGKSEERPARGASVDRTAWWEDQMELVTWRDGQDHAPPPPAAAVGAIRTAPATTPADRGTLRRLITMTGISKLEDRKSGSTLDSRRSIVAEFQAGPKARPTDTDGPMQIKWLDALDDAHLTAPGRSLTARRFLKANFLPPAVAAVDARPASSAGPAPATPPAAPLVAAADPGPDAEPRVEPAPEPAVDARADRVWATIVLGVGNVKNELQDAKLRGGVMVHQDPSPGKATGNDASGEALDLYGQGGGLMRFVVQAEEPPQASDPKTTLASARRPEATAVLARVDFDGKTIEAPRIGLDQKTDFAWASGPGNLVQMADRGLLDDKGIGEPAKVAGKSAGPGPKDRLVITWTDEMKFFGRSRDLQDRDVAKAEFRGESKTIRTPDGQVIFRRGVEAKMEDAAIYCDTMDVYMDKVISLNKVTTRPATDPIGTPPAGPNAEIAMLDCRGQDLVEDGRVRYAGVDITSQKMYPGTDVLQEKQRIRHVHVLYDKRSGEFEAPGPGTVYLYKRKNVAGADASNPIPTLIPVSARPGRGRVDAGTDARRVPPLELTKISFNEGMRGRFGVAKEKVDNQPRHAEFVGSVQSANATVARKNSDIDFDRPGSQDYMFLTSDVLHVWSIPAPADPKAPARQLLNARGNAQARTVDRTIQSDRITYDSATELTYAYGDEGKEVVMVEQKSPGQPPMTLRGKAGRYNKLTKEGRIEDPHSIQIFDLKTGVRPKPFYPDTGGSPKPADLIKQQRTPLQRQGRSSTERKSFTGGS